MSSALYGVIVDRNVIKMHLLYEGWQRKNYCSIYIAKSAKCIYVFDSNFATRTNLFLENIQDIDPAFSLCHICTRSHMILSKFGEGGLKLYCSNLGTTLFGKIWSGNNKGNQKLARAAIAFIVQQDIHVSALHFSLRRRTIL